MMYGFGTNVAIGYNCLNQNTRILPTLLFKTKLVSKQHIPIPNCILYYVYYYNKIDYYIQRNNKWLNPISRIDEALSIFNIMYPRWFTLYQYFKYNNDNVPLDIFINMIKYYIDIKPI
jgi:hypothetical protein